MSPSRKQLRPLSPEERVVYKQWMGSGILFYGSLVTLLITAAILRHNFAAASSDVVAGNAVYTTAIGARK
jgi:hypothetical protein